MVTALFPGKFQPPHIGHIRTLMKIGKKYDKIIICICEDEPKIYTLDERKAIFEEVFQHLPKYEVVLFNSVLTKSNSLKDLPDFDVCVSGNPKVQSKMQELGKRFEFVPRSEGIGESGTEIRNKNNERKRA